MYTCSLHRLLMSPSDAEQNTATNSWRLFYSRHLHHLTCYFLINWCICLWHHRVFKLQLWLVAASCSSCRWHTCLCTCAGNALVNFNTVFILILYFGKLNKKNCPARTKQLDSSTIWLSMDSRCVIGATFSYLVWERNVDRSFWKSQGWARQMV